MRSLILICTLLGAGVLWGCSDDDEGGSQINDQITVNTTNLSIFREMDMSALNPGRSVNQTVVFERVLDYKTEAYYYVHAGTSELLRYENRVEFSYDFDNLQGEYRFRAASLWLLAFTEDQDPRTDLPYHISLVGRYSLGPGESLHVTGECYAGDDHGLYNMINSEGAVSSLPLNAPYTDKIILLTKLDGINEGDEADDLAPFMEKGFEFTCAIHL